MVLLNPTQVATRLCGDLEYVTPREQVPLFQRNFSRSKRFSEGVEITRYAATQFDLPAHAETGASFAVNGAAQADGSALTTASADIRWLNGWPGTSAFGTQTSLTR
jgi:hypothetical protein